MKHMYARLFCWGGGGGGVGQERADALDAMLESLFVDGRCD